MATDTKDKSEDGKFVPADQTADVKAKTQKDDDGATSTKNIEAADAAGKFCPCGKAAVNFGDADGPKCPQHYTKGDDLVDGDPTDGDDTEADEGTNKGATEKAVKEVDQTDAGKELAQDPTQDAKPQNAVEKTVGNSQEATDKAGTTNATLDSNAKAGGFKNAADADKQAKAAAAPAPAKTTAKK